MMDFPTKPGAPGRTIVSAKCLCGSVEEIDVPTASWEAWRAGMLAQRAFPMLDVDTRERLISGTCGPCWDELFADEDDEDPRDPDRAYDGRVDREEGD